LGVNALHATYRYNARAKHPERIHIELPSSGLDQLEAALNPALQTQGLLVRLRVMQRSIPAWLASRDLEGDIKIDKFSVDRAPLGSLSARFVWLGPVVQFTSLRLAQGNASLQAEGSLDLSSYSPQWQFQGAVAGFSWGGGFLNADGEWQTSGTGLDSLHNLRANGTFSGEDIGLSTTDSFDSISGHFDFSFTDGIPNLRLAGIEAVQDENEWNGEAATQSDGKLVFDLAHAGRQLHVISELAPEKTTLLPHSPAVSAIGNDGRPAPLN
jgi:hypothetical protein